MKLTIKNLKTYRSMEYDGYNADLCIDGKKVCFVIDEGNGGCPHYDYVGKTRDDRDANETLVTSFINALPPEAIPTDAEQWLKDLYPTGFQKLTIDDYVARLVDGLINERTLARQRKTHVLAKLPTSRKGEYLMVKHKGNPEAAKAYVLKLHPDAVFI